jgi:RNA recognition motif-containing protein
MSAIVESESKPAIMSSDLEAKLIAEAKSLKPAYDTSKIQRHPRPDAPSGCVVALKNLPKNCTNDELRPFFELFGKVTVISVARDFYTGEPRRFGFVRYVLPISAMSAVFTLSTAPLIIRGSPVRVELSTMW